MDVSLHSSWEEHLINELEKPYFKQLVSFLQNEYATTTCYPLEKEIFAAFEYCHFDDVKVVILGQDPYHGPEQANGLCFSVKDDVPMPPSLINIFKEIEKDLGQPFPDSGNLEHWAAQGVLLLNATLTVRAHTAGSHQKQGWEKFTDAIIRLISDKKENIVFMLWGGYAKKKGAKIDATKHKILISGHPSPLSANRGYWFGNKHFSEANDFIQQQGQLPIVW